MHNVNRHQVKRNRPAGFQPNHNQGEPTMSEYCKLCGEKYSNARSLLSNRCPKNPIPNGKHVLFEGDQEGPFLCVHCGEKYTSLRSLVTNRCMHNPNGQNHEPFEGNPNGPFVCKFCGSSYPILRNLVRNRCTKNPERGGCHSPAR